MKKPGETVLKETGYIAAVTAVLSVILQVVFIALGAWSYKVILGNLWSGSFAVFNFLLMGITVEKAITLDEKEARKVIKTSQSMRQLMLLAVAAAGALVPLFNIWSAIIPLFFPRIAVSLRPLFGNNKK